MTLNRKLALIIAALNLLFLASTSYARSEELACPPDSVFVTMTPAPPGRGEWMAQYRKTLDSVGVGDVLILGDSHAYYWDAKTWAKSFPGRPAVHLGVSGDRTQNTLWRLLNFSVPIHAPQAVVLIVGANNLVDGEKSCAVAKGIAAIVEEIQRRWPDSFVYVVKPPPRGAQLKDGDTARAQVFEELAHLLTGSTVLIDADSALKCNAIPPTLLRYKTGLSSVAVEGKCPTYQYDMLHLTAVGYERLGNVLRAIPGPLAN